MSNVTVYLDRDDSMPSGEHVFTALPVVGHVIHLDGRRYRIAKIFWATSPHNSGMFAPCARLELL